MALLEAAVGGDTPKLWARLLKPTQTDGSGRAFGPGRVLSEQEQCDAKLATQRRRQELAPPGEACATGTHLEGGGVDLAGGPT